MNGGAWNSQPANGRVIFRAFEPIDVVALDLQSSQVGQLGPHEPVRDIRHGVELQQIGPAWTARAPDGDVLVCAGFGEVFPGRQALAWALFAEAFGRSVQAQGAVLAFMRARLAEQSFGRIEAIARAAMASECRWLERIGFDRAHVLRRWGPKGEDHILYERIA